MIDQPMEALKEANRIRFTRNKQRAELRGRSPAELTKALTDPPVEMASFRIRELFASTTERGRNGKATNPIPRFHLARLNAALQRYNCRADRFRQIGTEHRLRDLTRREREMLAVCVVAEAPRAWREAKPALKEAA